MNEIIKLLVTPDAAIYNIFIFNASLVTDSMLIGSRSYGASWKGKAHYKYNYYFNSFLGPLACARAY